MKRAARLNLCLAALLGVIAQDAGAIDWSYFGPYDSATGKPLTIFDFIKDAPAGHPTVDLNQFYDLVAKKLPEGKDIRTNNPGLITDDLGANLYLVEDAEVEVAFLHEGAGYLNTVGFFSFDPQNPPKTADALYNAATKDLYNHKVIFPNFSGNGSGLQGGGALKGGNTVKLGRYKAGTAIGFSILANAWSSGKVKADQPASMIFYTLKNLNPEPADAKNLNAHTVLLAKPNQEILALGFEDINRTWSNSDHDFNDVVVAIRVTPDTALDRSHIRAIDEAEDTDGDGVPDAIDVFPKDPDRSSRRFYPSATGYGHLAFEDNWPNQGDYDMNDLVTDYRIIENLNAKGQVVDVQLSYDLEARGAANANGFGIHLPGVSREAVDIAATHISIKGSPDLPLAPEEGQSEAVFILSSNVSTLLPSTPQCRFYSTEKSCARQPSVTIEAHVEFRTPQPSIGSAPFNPFLFRTGNRGVEVHLVDHPPTAKADIGQFGTGVDRSEPAKGRYYRSSKNLPWALDIPAEWAYPVEYMPITKAYPLFSQWAESAGAQATDWYSRAAAGTTY